MTTVVLQYFPKNPLQKREELRDSGMIKVAIVDDHDLFRKGLVALLDAEENIEVVLEAGNGRELIQRVKGIEVDVVLMDVEMPEMDGITATLKLKEVAPEARVVILSSYNEPEKILDAVEKGARGYLIKTTAPNELMDCIAAVVQNGFCFNQDVTSLVLKGVVEKDKFQSSFNPLPQLTNRELEVLELICREHTNAEIGAQLHLSTRTIEFYRKNMMEKIGARNSVGLVVFALKQGLVKL